MFEHFHLMTREMVVETFSSSNNECDLTFCLFKFDFHYVFFIFLI